MIIFHFAKRCWEISPTLVQQGNRKAEEPIHQSGKVFPPGHRAILRVFMIACCMRFSPLLVEAMTCDIWSTTDDPLLDGSP